MKKIQFSGNTKQLIVCCGLLLILLMTLGAAFPKHILKVCLANEQVTLPWTAHNGTNEYDFVVETIGSISKLRVRADDYVDYVKVNGVTNWTTAQGGGRKRAFFEVPLPTGWRPGTNFVAFHVRSLDEMAGFDIKEAHQSLTFGRLALVALIALIAFGFAFKMGMSPWLAWPVALAALLALQYLDETTPWIRQHDVGGHREYIEHFLSTGTLPAVKQGWETWQPPLYYVLASGWSLVFPSSKQTDPFCTVQVLACCCFLATIILALWAGYRLGLRKIQLFGTVFLLAFLPGHLFLAARINNDVLLPLLGLSITFCVFAYVRSGSVKVLAPLALLMAGILATKISSIAIVGGALLAIGIADVINKRPWKEMLFRCYMTALPSGLWLAFWIYRSADQTGELLYVNTYLLPENMKILAPAYTRLLSFDLNYFSVMKYHYDPGINGCYLTALLTSAMFGEYDLSEFGFQWSLLYRVGFLALLVPLGLGFFRAPKAELRPAWITCMALTLPQLLLIVVFAFQYPYSCDQNIRFAAQVFFPLACLWGLGLGHLWESKNRLTTCFLVAACGAFLAGIAEFYFRLLF